MRQVWRRLFPPILLFDFHTYLNPISAQCAGYIVIFFAYSSCSWKLVLSAVVNGVLVEVRCWCLNEPVASVSPLHPPANRKWWSSILSLMRETSQPPVSVSRMEFPESSWEEVIEGLQVSVPGVMLSCVRLKACPLADLSMQLLKEGKSLCLRLNDFVR